jgi:hypothetical protein
MFLTAEPRLRARVSPRRNCCGENDTGTHFSQRFSPVSIIPPWLSILIYHLGDKTVDPLVAAVSAHSLTPLT